MPCLAARTSDDGPCVRRTPSVGWLSKSAAGEGKDVAVGKGGQETGLVVTEWRASSRVPEKGTMEGLL